MVQVNKIEPYKGWKTEISSFSIEEYSVIAQFEASLKYYNANENRRFQNGLGMYFLNLAGQVFPEINLNFIVSKKGVLIGKNLNEELHRYLMTH